jgi:hypothetical protein
MCLMQTLSNYVIQLNCIIINFTLINMLLGWLQQQELIGEHMTWWLMRIIYKTGLILRLESNMYTLLRFLWHKQCHGIHVFHFLDILKSFDRCDVCNLTFVLCLHALTVSITLIFCWNFPKNTSLELLQCCIIALKKLPKHKVQCGILA